jgi:hypothetical protein
MPEPARLHPVERHHLEVLSDNVGVMQHAIGARPDPAHGYCTDDVARALQVDLLHGRELGWPAVADHARRSLRFIIEAFDPTTGGFRNFRSTDGTWLDRIGSEDCQGRALLALGEVIADGPDGPLVESATSLFELALPAARGLTALRAQASVVLACAATHRVARSTASGAAGTAGRLMAMRLLARFEGRVGSSWPWPEPRLTYENARPARALIVAGRTFGSERMVGAGLAVLDWLIDIQTSSDGHLTTIGNGWWPCGGERSRFDQQPIEATSLLLAAESAYQATGEPRYRAAIERAYGWFLGANDVGVDVADPTRGAGYDGLTPDGVNTNQGAESTLMWLVALEHVRAMRGGLIVTSSRATGAPRITPHMAAAAL